MPERYHSRRKTLSRIVLNLTLLLALFSLANASKVVAQPHSLLSSAATGTPSYNMVASDGGIFSYGDAQFYGSMGGQTLNKPIVGMAATPDGRGYWLVASDGGIFSYGDAQFYGSMGGQTLNKPIVGMAADPVTGGYWLVASDGGIFSFNAPFLGSTGGIVLNKPIVGMAATPDGRGYWLVASDGGIFSFGDAQFYGSMGGQTLNKPIVGMVETFSLDPYVAPEFGNDTSFPQCTSSTTYPTYFPPLSPPAVMVIGVSGFPFLTNQCLGSEYTSSQAQGGIVSLYEVLSSANYSDTQEVNNGPEAACAAAGSTQCQNYNWGYNAAQAAFTYANQQQATASTWWLDVEITNAYPSSYPNCSNGYLWSCSASDNQQVIQGASDFLTAHGVHVGLYSDSSQWTSIMGNYSLGLPTWIAGASSGNYSVYCTSPAYFFGGGSPWLVQVPPGNNTSGTTYDYDYAC